MFHLHPNTQLLLFHPKNSSAFSQDSTFTVNQKHTKECVFLDNKSENSILATRDKIADALATNYQQTPLGIQTADCLSLALSFGDQAKAHSLANIHAGWRGLLAGVIESTIQTYLDKMRDGNDSLVKVFIGPSIRKCCFEIKKDVMPNFESWAIGKSNFRKSSYQDAIPWLNHYITPDEAFVDLVALARFILEDSLPKHLSYEFLIHPDCTVCSKTKWGSFRRNKSYIEKNWLVATLK